MFGGHRYCTGTTGRVPGVHRVGPPIPEGPMGLSGKGNQPLVGWCAPPWAPPAPRVGNPRGGGAQTHLGFPLWPPPLP